MPAESTPQKSFESTLPHLSWWSFGFALAVTLGLFFGLHPLWEPTDASAVDATIAWSYAPIPLLVAGLLALERKLRWSSFLIETIKLTFVKFAITWLFANVLWSVIGAPAGHEAPRESAVPVESQGRFDVREAPPATPLDAAAAGTLSGIVVDVAGLPRAGALVAVTGGLDGIVFAPRPAGLLLMHDAAGLQPGLGVLLVHEQLVVRNTTDALHTVCAFDDEGKQLFNLPVEPQAQGVRMFQRPMGRVTLRCTVHGHGDGQAQLAVLANPFAAWTGKDGRFRLEGVPAGALQLTATIAGRAGTGAGADTGADAGATGGSGAASGADATASGNAAAKAAAALGSTQVSVNLQPGATVGDLRLTLP